MQHPSVGCCMQFMSSYNSCRHIIYISYNACHTVSNSNSISNSNIISNSDNNSDSCRHTIYIYIIQCMPHSSAVCRIRRHHVSPQRLPAAASGREESDQGRQQGPDAVAGSMLCAEAVSARISACFLQGQGLSVGAMAGVCARARAEVDGLRGFGSAVYLPVLPTPPGCLHYISWHCCCCCYHDDYQYHYPYCHHHHYYYYPTTTSTYYYYYTTAPTTTTTPGIPDSRIGRVCPLRLAPLYCTEMMRVCRAGQVGASRCLETRLEETAELCEPHAPATCSLASG